MGMAYYQGFLLLLPLSPLSVSIRRLHDRNKSGWRFLIVFLLVIGFIWLFVLFLLKGDEVTNRFGDIPAL